MIEKRVRIDMDIDTCPLLYTVQQNEENSRKIIISFTTNGVPFQIDTFTRVMVQLDKPDGTTVLEDSDGDYLNIVDNTVELIFSKQMTVASGRILGKLMFFDKESMVATTLFSINVNNGLIEESKIISSDEYSALINALIRVEAANQIAIKNIEDTRIILEKSTEVNNQVKETLIEANITIAECKEVVTEGREVIATANETIENANNVIDSGSILVADLEEKRDSGYFKGKKGDTGAPGISFEGAYAFIINDEGNLICHYKDNTTVPSLYINDEGHLIYDIDAE